MPITATAHNVISHPVRRGRRRAVWTVYNPDCGRHMNQVFISKDHAYHTAVSTLWPQAYAAAVKWTAREPKLGARAYKAIQIVAAGGITCRHPDCYLVPSQSRPGHAYWVHRIDGNSFCECEDFATRAPTIAGDQQRYCKHILALLLCSNYDIIENGGGTPE